MEFSKSGQIKTGAQLRADRILHGYCDTCRHNPTRCFRIKKRFGGLFREAIPLTIDHKVYKGNCLICRPDQDPNPRRATHPIHSSTVPGNNQIFQSDHVRRLARVEDHVAKMRSKNVSQSLQRQGGVRNLGQRLTPTNDSFEQLTPKYEVHSSEQEKEAQDDSTFDFQYDHLDASDLKNMNIFGEPIKVKPKKKRKESRKHRPGHHQHHRGHDVKHAGEQSLARDVSAADLDSSPTHAFSENQISSQSAQENQNIAQRNQNIATIEEKSDEDDSDDAMDPLLFADQPMDELARAIAQHCAKAPDQNRRFLLPTSGQEALIENQVLRVPVMDEDEISLVTLETALKGDDYTVINTSVKRFGAEALAFPNGPNSGQSKPGDQRSVSSHQIREPSPPQPNEYDYRSDAVDVTALRGIVSSCTEADNDEGAIEVVSEMLILDNDTNQSVDLALFCLTTLWALARKSDANKHKIIFEGRTLDAIAETMAYYEEISPAVQSSACGLLWSLAMNPGYRKHVAQLGGCDGILNAMVMHTDIEPLQVMALGALKVLSLDTIGKSTLRLKEASAIVADSMSRHSNNPTIQSEGCAILCNLAREANHFVRPVSKKEVDVIINAILKNPRSPDVHDGACFALMCFATSRANVDVIRQNLNIRRALQVAFQNHPEAVGEDVQALLERLHV